MFQPSDDFETKQTFSERMPGALRMDLNHQQPSFTILYIVYINEPPNNDHCYEPSIKQHLTIT